MAILIGNGQTSPYGVTPGADVFSALDNALKSNDHDIILIDATYTLDTPIDLDNSTYTHLKTLRLYFGGPHLGGFTRGENLTGAPLLSGGDGWNITINGMQIQEWDYHATQYPLCHFTNFESFEAVNTAWHRSHGGGLKLEITNSNRAGTVNLNTCRFDLYRVFGISMIDVGEIDMFGCHVQNNKFDANGNDNPIPGVLVTGGFRSPYGTIRGIHGEAAAYNGYWCLDVERANGLSILDSYLYLSSVRLRANASNCLVENNALMSSIIEDNGSNNTLALNTPDIQQWNVATC